MTAPAAPRPVPWWPRFMRAISTGSLSISVLALLLALVVGAVLIAATDPQVQHAATYFFSRPTDLLGAVAASVGNAYLALVRGAVFDARLGGLAAFAPLATTLNQAAPLVVAGLGVGLGFRAGVFNIGGQGQILAAAAFTGWVGFALELPVVLHATLAFAAGVVAASLWAGIAGVLKARTGASEVIVTIMLNYVALYLLMYALRTPGLLRAPGSNNPRAPAQASTAVLPTLLPQPFDLHLGLVIAVAATALAWWLLERSSLGFRLRAVGLNPEAAQVAGINVKRMQVYVMLLGGGFIGIAGTFQVMGTSTTGFGSGIDAGLGIDAITVALLGRSRAWPTLAAGVLLGALKAGGFTMQASQGVAVDIVLVIQSVIILLVAAPPLVRSVFRLPDPARVRPAPTKEVRVA